MVVATKKRVLVLNNFNGQPENIFNDATLSQHDQYFKVIDKRNNTHIYSNSMFGYVIEFDGVEELDKNDN